MDSQVVIPMDIIEQFEEQLLERLKAPAIYPLGFQCLEYGFGDRIVVRISLLAQLSFDSMSLQNLIDSLILKFASTIGAENRNRM